MKKRQIFINFDMPPPPGYNSNTNGVKSGNTIPQATPKNPAFGSPAPGTPTRYGSPASQNIGTMKPRTKK
ncbi:MAG: hypothetical protein WD512_05955 [Candidatus Paceibacterota bacterium]